MDSLQQLRELLSEELTPLREQITNMQQQISAVDEKTENISRDMNDMRQDISNIHQDLNDMRQDISNIHQDLNDVRQDISNINMVLENDIRPSIQKIAEGHAGLAEKYSRINKIADDIDEMKGSMAVLEVAITRNASSIIELQKAQA